MENLNAVKFSILVHKTEVKAVLNSAFDKDINLLYPNMLNAPDIVKVKGVATLESFQELIFFCESECVTCFEKIEFFKGVKFKLIEINDIKQPIPFAEKKDIIK